MVCRSLRRADGRVARIIAERLRSSLGQPVIIENVSGAGGSIAVGRVPGQRPMATTLSMGQSTTHVVNGAIYALQYDLLNDLETDRTDCKLSAIDRRQECYAGELT